MPFIPSNKDKPTQSVTDMATENVAAALAPFIKGKNVNLRLAEATAAVVSSIEHMLTMREVRQQPLGATVMTEGASARKEPGSVPRNI